MRAKTAVFLHKLTRLIASAGVGYAIGRLHQRTRDEGSFANYRDALKTGADALDHAMKRRMKDYEHGD